MSWRPYISPIEEVDGVEQAIIFDHQSMDVWAKSDKAEANSQDLSEIAKQKGSLCTGKSLYFQGTKYMCTSKQDEDSATYISLCPVKGNEKRALSTSFSNRACIVSHGNVGSIKAAASKAVANKDYLKGTGY